MDDELRQAFATLASEMAGMRADISASTSLMRETNHDVKQLGVRVEKLERHVFGSIPPTAQTTPVVHRISSAEGEVSELAGQIIAVKSELAEVKRTNEEQSTRIEDLASKVQLVYEAVTGFFQSPKVRFVGRMVFVLAAGYAAAKGVHIVP